MRPPPPIAPLLRFQCQYKPNPTTTRKHFNSTTPPTPPPSGKPSVTRRVPSAHDPHWAYKGIPINRLAYAPSVSFGRPPPPQGPRIRKDYTNPRAESYIPRSEETHTRVRKVQTVPGLRRVSLGPAISRDFVRRTFHPNDRRAVLGEVMTAPRERTGAGVLVEGEGEGAETGRERGRVSKNGLSLEGHRVDRADVQTGYVDTHCHLFTTLKMLQNALQDETIPRDAVNTFVEKIFPKEVVACVDIHCDLPVSDYHEKAAALEWPAHFKYYFAVGAHPHTAMEYTDDTHARLIAAMSHPSCVAWGECGLDFFKNDPSTHATQRAVFTRQLTAAVALNKPIVVHTRDADADTLACILEAVPKSHRIHIHCFTAGPALAHSLLNLYPNAFIGITGVVSYAGVDHVHELLRSGDLPIERVLLETDSPYMVPRSAYAWLQRERPEWRKKRFLVSHAGMIPFTAEKVVEVVNEGRRKRGEVEISLSELLEVTRGNAGRMYGIEV